MAKLAALYYTIDSELFFFFLAVNSYRNVANVTPPIYHTNHIDDFYESYGNFASFLELKSSVAHSLLLYSKIGPAQNNSSHMGLEQPEPPVIKEFE